MKGFIVVRNSRSRTLLVGSLAAVLLALVSVLAAPDGSAAPAGTPTVPSPQGPTDPVLVPATMTPACPELSELLAEALRDGRDLVTCLTVEPADALPATTASTPVPPPRDCGTRGYYAVTRLWACGVFLSRLNFIDVRTGAVVGTLEYSLVDYSFSSNSLSNWMQQVQWQFNSATGVGLTRPQTITGRAACTGSCYLSSLDFPPQSAAVGREAHSHASNTTTATTAGAIGFGTSRTYWHFYDAYGTSTEAYVTAPRLRCDNAMPGNIGVGCVWPQFVPTVQYSQSGTRAQIARHISQAQASGLPGSFAARSYLHRLTNQTQIGLNRDQACGSPPPAVLAPSTNNCDEYPFASTYEGAWTGGGTARTQSGCYYVVLNPSTGSSGYSICSVDAAQNSGAGSDLGGFYARNRVIDRDPFMVQVY